MRGFVSPSQDDATRSIKVKTELLGRKNGCKIPSIRKQTGGSDKGYFLIFFISDMLHCLIGQSYSWDCNNILWEKKISKKFRLRAKVNSLILLNLYPAYKHKS
jgi:hypothetical protein